MGAVKNWKMRLQEMPEYFTGYSAYESGIPRDLNPVDRKIAGYYDRLMAWYAGWDDAKFAEYMENVSDEPPE